MLESNVSLCFFCIQLLFGLEYAHALQDIRTRIADNLLSDTSFSSICCAEVACSTMDPSLDEIRKEHLWPNHGLFTNGDSKMIPKSNQCTKMEPTGRYNLGGLTWNMPSGQQMEDCLLFWIGSDDAAFANVVLTFNNCDVGKVALKLLIPVLFGH